MCKTFSNFLTYSGLGRAQTFNTHNCIFIPLKASTCTFSVSRSVSYWEMRPSSVWLIFIYCSSPACEREQHLSARLQAKGEGIGGIFLHLTSWRTGGRGGGGCYGLNWQLCSFLATFQHFGSEVEGSQWRRVTGDGGMEESQENH